MKRELFWEIVTNNHPECLVYRAEVEDGYLYRVVQNVGIGLDATQVMSIAFVPEIEGL